MQHHAAEVIIAGHICLDIIPTLSERKDGVDSLFAPGKLVNVGPALIATGGAVSNTGIALHRLGSKVKLMGKIGDDPFGRTVVEVLQRYHPSLSEGMIVTPGEHTSYTMVINPPHVDRIFFHFTGANDTYTADDVKVKDLQHAKLFHFGYPPLMRSMYVDDGDQLSKLLSLAKSNGLTVSLDLAMPDPDSHSGQANWKTILSQVLSYTDVFLPSFEEIVFMLHHDLYKQWMLESRDGNLLPYASGSFLHTLSDELLTLGVAIVAIKLGEHGLYVRTTGQQQRLLTMGACAPSTDEVRNWVNRELITPCFRVDVAGTTGAGDCTIAGFLMGLLQSLSIEKTVQLAVGVGACSVEKADAASGVPTLEQLQKRINCGWVKYGPSIELTGWLEREYGLWEWVGISEVE